MTSSWAPSCGGGGLSADEVQVLLGFTGDSRGSQHVRRTCVSRARARACVRARASRHSSCASQWRSETICFHCTHLGTITPPSPPFLRFSHPLPHRPGTSEQSPREEGNPFPFISHYFTWNNCFIFALQCDTAERSPPTLILPSTFLPSILQPSSLLQFISVGCVLCIVSHSPRGITPPPRAPRTPPAHFITL